MEYTRRDALKVGLFGSAALAIPLERAARARSVFDNRMPTNRLPAPFSLPFRMPRVAEPFATDGDEDRYRISMDVVRLEILPGFQTTCWGYGGTVPGPTVMMEHGRKSKIRFVNNLPLKHPTLGFTPWTSVHLHGSPSLPQYDGYANDITFPGQYKDYHYPNSHDATTHWYHDHGVHHTTENIWMGLAGMYQIHDDQDRSLPIPHGDYDVPLVIADRMFDNTGELLFAGNDRSGMFGDVNLVNGVPWPLMKVQRRKYRFRLLNGSISRAYNLSLSNGDPFVVIGTDGGLMPAPQTVRSMRHMMGERYEVVIDFAKYNPGTRIVLTNTNPKNNIAFPNIDKVMAFEVTNEAFDPTDNEIPPVLNPGNRTMNLQAAQSVRTRRMSLERKHGMWTVNGRVWDDVVASGFTLLEADPQKDSIEIWELVNKSGGWQHPMHMHLVEFQLLSRNGRPPFAYERGPKDVAYLGENETVRAITQFDGTGKYMMHCHNMVHEDHDMMVQFEVIDPDNAGIDPLSFPAKNTALEAADPL
jgi:FtsP/CotA-like multicopper oxidase with cupredoxin domain